MPPEILWGDLYLAHVHSQMNPQTWTKVGANRFSRLTAFPYFWMFDPLKPSSAPLVSRKAICLAYIHSQMNLHICAKFRANRSSRLTASTYFWICDPLKPPKMPPGILMGELYLAYVHSQTNPQQCTTVGANLSSYLTASPGFCICDPLKPPFVMRGVLYLAYVDSQTNPLICTKCGANRSSSRLTASPNIWIWDPLTPPPQMPWGIVGRIVISLYPFPDESADVYQIWC